MARMAWRSRVMAKATTSKKIIRELEQLHKRLLRDQAMILVAIAKVGELHKIVSKSKTG